MAGTDSPGHTKGVCEAVDGVMERWPRQKQGAMRYPPYWFQRGRIVRETGNDMPMDMRQLVSEEFVVHLLRLMDGGRDLGHSGDLFDQLNTFGGRKLE